MPAIPSPRAGRRPRLEIIPFIDIMFFLLATFMMVSLSMIDIQGIDLNLPGANSAKPQDQNDHTQTVSVAKSGELFLNKEPITLSNLQERFSQLITGDPETRLVVQGDYDCSVWTCRRSLRQRPDARIEQVGNSNGPSGATVSPMPFEGRSVLSMAALVLPSSLSSIARRILPRWRISPDGSSGVRSRCGNRRARAGRATRNACRGGDRGIRGDPEGSAGGGATRYNGRTGGNSGTGCGGGPGRSGGTSCSGRTERPRRNQRARNAARAGAFTYGHARARRRTRDGSVGAAGTCAHADCQAAAAKSSRFRQARQRAAEGEGGRVQSRDGGERGKVGSCGLLAEPSSGLSRRSEAKRTARSSSLSCRRERCWARGISDAHQKLRLSDFGRFGARGGAQMEVPSGDHRRSQGFLDSESSGSIHARLEARR